MTERRALIQRNIFLLSLAGPIALYSVVGPSALLLAFTSIVNALQSYRSVLKYFSVKSTYCRL